MTNTPQTTHLLPHSAKEILRSGPIGHYLEVKHRGLDCAFLGGHGRCRLTRNENKIVFREYDPTIIETDVYNELFEGLDEEQTKYMMAYLVRTFSDMKNTKIQSNVQFDIYLSSFARQIVNEPIREVTRNLPVIYPLWKLAIEKGLVEYDHRWVDKILHPIYEQHSYLAISVKIAQEKLRDFATTYEENNILQVRDVHHIDPNRRINLVLDIHQTDLV